MLLPLLLVHLFALSCLLILASDEETRESIDP